MYGIEKTDYGYRLIFSGRILETEMAAWVEESDQLLDKQQGKFSVLIDMRRLDPIASEAQVQMQKGQRLYKQKGMERSVVVLENPTLTLQFKRIAKQTGILLWERYIDSNLVKNWEEVALDWIKNGVEPKEE
jgi:hypothetical protein